MCIRDRPSMSRVVRGVVAYGISVCGPESPYPLSGVGAAVGDDPDDNKCKKEERIDGRVLHGFRREARHQRRTPRRKPPAQIGERKRHRRSKRRSAGI